MQNDLIHKKCDEALAARDNCKSRFGLSPRQCYPERYQNQCDREEFELKKCISFALCFKEASILYDNKNASRAAKLKANKRIQKCLKNVEFLKCQGS